MDVTDGFDERSMSILNLFPTFRGEGDAPERVLTDISEQLADGAARLGPSAFRRRLLDSEVDPTAMGQRTDAFSSAARMILEVGSRTRWG